MEVPPLIDAKREYVGQLTDVLAPFVVGHVQALYVAAAKQHPREEVILAFQGALRATQHWNATTTRARAAEIEKRYPWLFDLVAACFVAYVQILSSVKLHQQKPNIRLKLPENERFVHQVYVNVAREFYAAPRLVHADRAAKVAVVRAAVEATVRDMLPIQDILKAYLGNTVDASDHTMNPAELQDDEFEAAQPGEQAGFGAGDAAAPAGFGAGDGFGPEEGAGQLSQQPQGLTQPEGLQPQGLSQPDLSQPQAVPPFTEFQPQGAQAPLAPAPTPPPQPQPQAPLFGDDAPKHISLSAQAQAQPAQPVQGVPHQAQPLFSDAEDDF
jgi:hypothetical protein